MFELTESSIQSCIDSIAGFLVHEVSAQTGMAPEAVAEALLQSQTFAQLSDPETGWYWDSMAELRSMFLAELGARVDAD